VSLAYNNPNGFPTYRPTRARVTQNGGYENRCTLVCEDEDGAELTRDFFAPEGGGSVRENWESPRQVCEGLSGGGATLEWDPTRGPLVGLIRRERRAGLAADRRRGSSR